MDSEYITIQEYAKLRGCTVPAVYKRLDGTLKDYYEIVNGRKMLRKQVLEDEGLLTETVSESDAAAADPADIEDDTVDPLLDEEPHEEPAGVGVLQRMYSVEYVDHLLDEIKYLREQLNREQQLVYLANQALLQAAPPAASVAPSGSEAPQSDAEESESKPEPPQTPAQDSTPEPVPAPEKKKSFWQRLFG